MEFPLADDDPARAVHIFVFGVPGPNGPKYQIRVGEDENDGCRPKLYRFRRSAIVDAMHLSGSHPNGAVIHVFDAGGDYVGSEAHRPFRILVRIFRHALRSRFPLMSFVFAMAASMYYFHTSDVTYDTEQDALAQPVATALGFTLVTLTVLISLGTATALGVGLDHRKSWILRKEIVLRSVAFVGLATGTVPFIGWLYLETSKTALTNLVAIVAVMLLFGLLGILRISVSIFCYAVDTAENA